MTGHWLRRLHTSTGDTDDDQMEKDRREALKDT